MDTEQRDYLLGLIKHDLAMYKWLDLDIKKEKIELLLNELKYFKEV